MASVTFSPGAAFVPGASNNNYIQWEDRTGPVGLVDASVLSGDTSPKYVQRIRFWRTIRADKIYLNAETSTPDGSNAFDGGDELNEQWESYSAALVISAGGTTWTFAGPANTQNSDQDAGEPYGWVTSADAVNAFITAYEAKTDVQKDATTITLDDGVAVASHEVTPSTPVGWSFALPQPTVRHTRGHFVSPSSPVEWSFELPEASVDHGRLSGTDHAVVPSSPVAWAFALPQVGVAHVPLVPDVVPDSAMVRWLRSLLLPWDELTGRWATALALADTFQGLIDAAEQARHEWSPVTCRTATLPAWGRVLGRPRRTGESTPDYRRRLALWRSEPVGTSGWVRDEITRITGDDPPKVLEFPRDGLVVGHGRVGVKRIGAGPSLTVGVDPTMREALAAVLEAGVPPDVGITYLSPSIFDTL